MGNASPSLAVTTDEDRLLKLRLINDVLNVVVPPNLGDGSASRPCTSWCEEEVVGGFVCIFDENRQRHRPESIARNGGVQRIGEERGVGPDGRRRAARPSGWR